MRAAPKLRRPSSARAKINGARLLYWNPWLPPMIDELSPMTDTLPSNRPTPRTAAAVEAELRRRVRTELIAARAARDDGALDDADLAGVIARAVAQALSWHLEGPEHARLATTSSRTWRGA